MVEREKSYRLILSKEAEIAYYSLLTYFFEHYSFDRAMELSEAILDFSKELIKFPSKGKLAEELSELSEEFRFQLFKRSKSAEVKVVYFVNEEKQEVVVTDFFPTEMRPDKVGKTIR